MLPRPHHQLLLLDSRWLPLPPVASCLPLLPHSTVAASAVLCCAAFTVTVTVTCGRHRHQLLPGHLRAGSNPLLELRHRTRPFYKTAAFRDEERQPRLPVMVAHLLHRDLSGLR
jgi:hypothetical protein